MSRRLWVILHRYAGLATAVFLVITGITGSAIAFYPQLDAWLNPTLYRTGPPPPGAEPLEPAALRAHLKRQAPEVETNYMPLRHARGRALAIFVEPVKPPNAASATPPQNDEYFIDPYTGTVLGGRRWGDLSQGIGNLLPFLYRLHYALALDTIGAYVLGIVALLWTIDCFIGAYLTFPLNARRDGNPPARKAKSWWSQWGKSWKVRWSGGAYKLNFDLHRASGLWLWAMLLIFAWSSVGLNLNQVYHPVMKALFSMADIRDTLPDPTTTDARQEPDWNAAYRSGRALMAAEAAKRGFTVVEPAAFGYDPGKRLFFYRVSSTLDVSERFPDTIVWLNGETGALVAFDSPATQPLGNAVTTWLYALHFGAVWGLPFRIFVCVMGVVVAVLSGTGVWIWWKKRSARRHRAAMPPRRSTSTR